MTSNYLEFPEGLGTFTRPRWSAVLAAAGVWLGAAHLGLAAYGDAPSRDGTFAPSALLYYYGLVGPIVGALYYVLVDSLNATRIARYGALVLALVLFSSWFATPVLNLAGDSATGVEQAAEGYGAGTSSREAWLGNLIASGRYAAPDVPPPFLEVQRGEYGVRVTNLAEKDVKLALASVTADARANGGWRGCALAWRDGSTRNYWVTLAPGELAFFERGPICSEIVYSSFASEQIEFRVGDESVPVEEGWWSTSALVAPGGRESENGSGRMPLARSYDIAPFFGVEP